MRSTLKKYLSLVKLKVVEILIGKGNFEGMDRINLKEMKRSELESFVSSLGLESFRGRQIFRWIFRGGATDFDVMTDLSKKNRTKLNEKAFISQLAVERTFESSDGSARFLFKLDDGFFIESVLIPENRRLTLCVSSQAGCALRCRFCATGQMGFNRNLTAGEIVDQFLQVQKRSDNRITNIVFMGMGEPTLNLKSVLKACEILSDDYGPSLSCKRITISTVGVTHALKKLVSQAGKLGLAISLHSADEEVRKRIIPAAQNNRLQDIMAEAKRYTELSGRRVSFEYLLLGGVTDSIEEAGKLVKLIHGIPCKINLIRYNPGDGLPFKRPAEEDVQRFKEYLYPRTYAVTVRESRGLDIGGACGQLAGVFLA
jgi:23S rRNA (adenine2503-C2)-methyltransferase